MLSRKRAGDALGPAPDRVPGSGSSSGSWFSPHAEPQPQNAVERESEPAPARTPRTKACTLCRKQKIKCEMGDIGPPCVRCVQRGTSCVLDSSLDALLEYRKQNELLQQDAQNMHRVLQQLCHKLNVDPPDPLASLVKNRSSTQTMQSHYLDVERERDIANESSPPMSPSTVQAPIDTFMNDVVPSTTAGTEQSPRKRRATQSHPAKDLVSQRLITMENAESLVERYFTQLDHSLYNIASQYENIHAVRRASPVLLAAICTVSALHSPRDQELYEICNREFRRVVSASLFEKRDIEYIRALCIGSFWLTDSSRFLTSDAVRRAADMRLHRYFYQVVDTKTTETPLPALLAFTTSREEARDRIRLWYIIFICDQHLSILHNIDGLLRHDRNILHMWDQYLGSDGGNERDSRIMSQVSILLISNAVRDTFGSDHPEEVPKSLLVHLNHFSRQLDDWFARISSLYNPDPRIGDFPKAGIQMHFHFGKLYLGHHVFRGLRSNPIPLYFLPAASMALGSAISIFEMVLNDKHLQQSLVGRPHYVFIMISFAGNFLLEICKIYAEQLSINLDDTFTLVDRVLSVLADMPLIPQHPINRMTRGLRRKMNDCASTLGIGSPLNETLGQSQTAHCAQPDAAYSVAFLPVGNNDVPPPGSYDFSTAQMPLMMNQYMYPYFEEFNFPDMNFSA